jgi:hypothetical protein
MYALITIISVAIVGFVLIFVDWCSLKTRESKEVKIIAKRDDDDRIVVTDDNHDNITIGLSSEKKFKEVNIGDTVTITYQTSRWGWHNDWYLE